MVATIPAGLPTGTTYLLQNISGSLTSFEVSVGSSTTVVVGGGIASGEPIVSSSLTVTRSTGSLYEATASISQAALPTASVASGLSTGAKAGIGVGAALGGLLLVSLAGLAYFYYRKFKRHHEVPATTIQEHYGNDKVAYATDRTVPEMDAVHQQRPAEMQGEEGRYEMAGGAYDENERKNARKRQSLHELG